MSKLSDWIAPRKRLWSIFNELGYVPWRKPRKPGKSKKGVHMFLGNFFLLWLAMSLLLGKKYGVSVSGAAAASAYVLCQFCVFMFLALLVSLGQKAEIGVLLMGLLLFIDYMQLLGVGKRKALGLTLKTGLVYITAAAVFYLLVGAVLILLAYLRA